MTSKNLFFKLQKEDLKRRIWTIALSVIVFFLALPIVCAMYLSNSDVNSASDYITNRKRLFEELLHLMGASYEGIILITITGAIICALSGFFYLHSKKKVDFYHSIPVRREVLFAISYINGILIYLIPYVISVVLCFLIMQINQVMNIEIFTTAISAIGVNLLFYSLIYTIVVIAVVLTGNFVISCFGTAVFLLYGPMLSVLKEMYFSEFFAAYYSINSRINSLLFLSPIGIYYDTTNLINSNRNQGIYGRIFIMLIVTILFIGFAVFLYKKRPSQAAGKAMAFSISKPIIKVLLVIPLSLGGGMMFKGIANNRSNGWFLFGLIFSLLIVYAVIEIIYNFDIRSAFLHKKHLLTCTGVITVIVCIFQFDLLHYDSYIPKKSNIKSMSVAIYGIDDHIQYMEPQLANRNDVNNNYNYIDNASYQLKYMELTDFNSAYSMADIGRKQVDNENYVDSFVYSVKYSLKSGREIYRIYHLNSKESFDMIKDIYANKEFKEGHFPIYKLDIEDFENVICNNILSKKEIILDKNEKKQFLEIYKEELNNLTLEEMSITYPIATISLQFNKYYEMNIDVYPTFKNTVEFLKDRGFDATKEVVAKDIIKIEVQKHENTDYNITYDDYKSETSSTNIGYETVNYVNEEQIKEILPNLIRSEIFEYNNTIYNIEDSIQVNVMIRKDEYGNEEYYPYYFKQGGIPDFVKEDINYSTVEQEKE